MAMRDQSESQAPLTAPRIYAASRASLPARPAMWQQLRAEGFNIISSWIDEAELGATSDLGELWERIAAEIASADGLVLYVEEDDFPLKGALIECGIALGLDKEIHIVSPDLELKAPSYRPLGSWVMHPNVVRFRNVRQACQAKFDAAKSREQGWVSVEERLPENYGQFWVFVVVRDADGNLCGQAKEAGWDKDGGWLGCEGATRDGKVSPVVTHWQPLPAPPKEQSNGRVR